MTSLVYRSAAGYELVMRALYGRHYRQRLAAVAGLIPDGASVLELCCGPGTLYRRHLKGRVSHYTGLDVNQRFVERLVLEGIDARRVDLTDGSPLPKADVVLMQASLYHFLPEPRPIIDRMLGAASERVVVAEPIRNLASSGLPVIGRIGRRAADPGVGGHAQRFDEPALDELMAPYEQTASFKAPGGREKLFVLRPSR